MHSRHHHTYSRIRNNKLVMIFEFSIPVLLFTKGRTDFVFMPPNESSASVKLN